MSDDGMTYEEMRKRASVARGRPPALAAARHRERGNRNGNAQARALRALAKVYPEKYREFYLAAKAEIDAERGPLPGDETRAAE